MQDDRQDVIYQEGLRIAARISQESISQGRRRRPDDEAGTAAARASTSSTTTDALGFCQSALLADEHCVLSEEECLDMPPSEASLRSMTASSVEVRQRPQPSMGPTVSSVEANPAAHQQQQQCHCGVQGRRTTPSVSSVEANCRSGMPGLAVDCHSLRSCEPVLYVAVSAQVCALDHPLAPQLLVR